MTGDPGFAPAKVNLALHVTGQGADGYHQLDSLVMFADVGDRVQVEPADTLGLSVTGPMSAGVPTDETNLVLKAAKWLHPTGRAHLTLQKFLPAAAGIGGGSSDAAAALRILSEFWGRPIPHGSQILGADVPVCLAPTAQRMSGIGEETVPVKGICSIPAVLVNPNIPVSTPDVFAALTNKTNAPLPSDLPILRRPQVAIEWVEQQRNDLQPAAINVVPEISNVLDALERAGAGVARMSGSGATCFGLFASQDAADCAAAELSLNANWWVQPTLLS